MPEPLSRPRRLERHNYARPVCRWKPRQELLSDEGSLLKRVVAAFLLLLGLTFMTLTLYLTNVQAVTQVLQSYVVRFP